MSDADQMLGSAAKTQPEEIDGAIFGDHPVHVAARGDHARPGIERRDNAAAVPPDAIEGSAMIGLPFVDSAAPRIKSIWPPIPL